MEIILKVLLSALALSLAYWFGWTQRNRVNPADAKLEFWDLKLLKKRFVYAAMALPLLWLLYFYGLVAHVWVLLDRWPSFGEGLPSRLARMHYDSVGLIAAVLFVIACVAAAAFPAALCFPKTRHRSMYALAYLVSVGACFGAIYLAPGSFLNWFFD